MTFLLLLIIWNSREFLIDCRNYISVFSALCVFPKLSFGQRVPLAFIADLGLRKVVLRVGTRFVIIELNRKKNLKNGVFVIPVGQKVV